MPLRYQGGHFPGTQWQAPNAPYPPHTPYAQYAQYAQYPQYPQFPPRPPRPPRRWLGVTIAATLAVALLACGGTITALLLSQGRLASTESIFVDPNPESRDVAVAQIVQRRAKAVLQKDKEAFLADVDPTDQAELARQELEYDNLTVLPFAEFGYDVEPSATYDSLVPSALKQRFKTLVRAQGVTLRYRIDGLDDKAIAVPWVPIFGMVDGVWRIVGEVSDKGLPHGANGQPWDAPVRIAMVRGDGVFLVTEASAAEESGDLVKIAEDAIGKVMRVRPAGWPGKVMVTGLADDTVFTSYFRDTPDVASHVAAFAAPQYDTVLGWDRVPQYAAGRVVLSPQLLDDPEFQPHAITHEFAHVAMFPVTSETGPMWMIEGFAEYVAYKTEDMPARAISAALAKIDRGRGLPSDASFEEDDAPYSYLLGWLACRMIAERWGESTLVALYEALGSEFSENTALRQVIGIDERELNRQTVEYIDSLR